MTSTSSVGVLGGTGPLGRGLALRLAQAGHRVIIGSRDAQRAQARAKELCAEHGLDEAVLDGAGNDTAADADVVVVAVPFDGVEATLPGLARALIDKVVVSCVNRLAFDGAGPHPVPVPAGSAAELIAELLPDSRVVGAFHHVPAARMRRGDVPVDMDVLITGDDDRACEAVGSLVEAIPGMRAVRAGPLRLSRPIEELTAVVVSVNKRYGVNAGIRIAGLGGAAD
jgi:NADPH-dependent F420 reductase